MPLGPSSEKTEEKPVGIPSMSLDLSFSGQRHGFPFLGVSGACPSTPWRIAWGLDGRKTRERKGKQEKQQAISSTFYLIGDPFSAPQTRNREGFSWSCLSILTVYFWASG